jgi:hypothetical protein
MTSQSKGRSDYSGIRNVRGPLDSAESPYVEDEAFDTKGPPQELSISSRGMSITLTSRAKN